MKKIFLLFAAMLTCIAAKATDEVYTSYNATTRTLTYYFDDQREARTAAGETTELYAPDEIRFATYHDDIRLVIIDESMKDAHLTTTKCMFYGNYADGDGVFNSLSNLTEIRGMENLVTDEVTNMRAMFYKCAALDTIDLSHFNTANVTSMADMFGECQGIKTFNLMAFNPSKVASTGGMFADCTSLETIYCNTDWSQSELLTYSEEMFKNCSNLRGSNGTRCIMEWDKLYARPDIKNGDHGYFTSVKEVYTSYDAETKTLTYYYDTKRQTRTGIIAFCRNEIAVIPIGFSWEDVEKAVIDASFANFPLTTLSSLFLDFYNLKEVVGLSNFNTENVTDMSYMFANCFVLETIDLSPLNTANVTDMSNMFLYCTQLKDVKLTNLNTSNVTDFEYMFLGCSSLTELDLNNFDVSHATTFQGMFCYCASLKTIMCQDDWNIGDIESQSMFRDCNALVGGKGTVCDGSTDPGLPFAHPDGGGNHPGYFTIPTGKLNGLFTVNNKGKQVVFSRSNLQYQSSTGKWQLGSNQWVRADEDEGWIDLFAWGTGNAPASSDEQEEFTDWGVNAISKGAFEPGYWRTLTNAEWTYVMKQRDNWEALVGLATVNGIHGIVLLPDAWSLPKGMAFSAKAGQWTYNVYNLAQWKRMEDHGAVFLPVAGYKDGSTVSYPDKGYYWSSTQASSDKGYEANFETYSYYISMGNNSLEKTQKLSVRLVRDAGEEEKHWEYAQSDEPCDDPVKKIGVFSIGDARKVVFSQGNLQYCDSTHTYRFAEKQYDVIGDNNRYIGQLSPEWIDLFCWGTGDRSYFYSGLESQFPGFVDWGINPICNGGNEPGQWRTLDHEEWDKVVYSREGIDTLRGRATVNGVKGFLLLPDNWVKPDGINVNPGISNKPYSSNVYTAEQWSRMEAAGAVFLPTAGSRNMTSVSELNAKGYYWASDAKPNGDWAYNFNFGEGDWGHGVSGSYYRHYGYCVRLVKDLVVEPVPANEETTFDFSAIDEKGTEVLGILLSDKDTYNEDENRVEITKTNKQDSIELVLNKEWDGETAPKTFLPGTINFELEPGERDIEIDCQTKPGYTIRVHLAEYGEAHITATVEQAARGKATVHYKATKNTYVVIYLYNESTSSSAPLRMARAKAEGDMDAGAYIYSIKIAPFIPMDITAKQDPDDSGNYYSTFFDSAKKYALPNDGTEAYTAKIDAEGNMVLTKVAENDQVIPANTAVILKATSPSFALARSNGTAVSVPEDNELLGVDEATAAPDNCYVLSGHSKDNTVQGVGFYMFNGTLPAHKAYILYTGSTLAPSHRMRFIFSEEQTVTGVENVQNDDVQRTKVMEDGVLYMIKNGVRYNAQGQIVK